MIQCEPDIISNPFSDITVITYEIELFTAGKKIGFNLLDNKDFTILYVSDTIPNSPAGYQLPTQAKTMCGSLLSMENSLSQLKAHLMNSIAIKIHV